MVIALAISSGSGAMAAGTKTWMKAGKTYTISVTASDGSVYKITGTKKKIEIALARLEKKAAAPKTPAKPRAPRKPKSEAAK